MPDASAVTLDRGDLESLLARLIDQAGQRWLPLDRAAEYSGLSIVTLRRLIAAGKLKPRRPVKGKVLVDRVELHSLIDSSTAEPRTGRGRHRH